MNADDNGHAGASVDTSPGAMDGPDTAEREQAEFRDRMIVLEEQLDSHRQALALLSVAIMVACIVAAGVVIRSARS